MLSILACISLLVAGVVGLKGYGYLDERAIVGRLDPCDIVYANITEVIHTVVINQYFGSNTILNIDGGVTININNAPTTLITTVLSTETVTRCVQMTFPQ